MTRFDTYRNGESTFSNALGAASMNLRRDREWAPHGEVDVLAQISLNPEPAR